jgi:2-phosphosulfolactate phosphatase
MQSFMASIRVQSFEVPPPPEPMSSAHLEVLFTPNEFTALTPARLENTVCVVFDILRATTSIITALAHGARAVRPSTDIQQAVDLRKTYPEILLGGERQGWRITAKDSGGIEFDFGNSPAEYTSPRLNDRTLAITTTNGTRALEAAARASHTFVASFLNLTATINTLRELRPQSLLIIAAGTYEEAALEDSLAAGALSDALWGFYSPDHVADSATIARMLWQHLGADLPSALARSRNGRRLLRIPELQADVAFAAQRDVYPLTAQLETDGFVRALPRGPV